MHRRVRIRTQTAGRDTCDGDDGKGDHADTDDDDGPESRSQSVAPGAKVWHRSLRASSDMMMGAELIGSQAGL